MYVILFIVLLAIDQISKYLAILHLKGQDEIVLIKNWLHLTYVENSGAAFGIMQHATLFFTLITLFVVFGILYYLLKNGNNVDSFYKIILVIIMAGAIGNLIDRIRFNYVVDFIFTPLGGLYDFPVFNFADIYITLSAIVIIVYTLFFEDKHV